MPAQTYFDVDDDTHTKLLSEEAKKARDLARVAEQVEADVINEYTLPLDETAYHGSRPLGVTQPVVVVTAGRSYTALDGYHGVFLRDFTVDAAACTNTDLKLAMRRTVADIIAWRLERAANASHVKSSVSGAAGIGSAISYRHAAADLFPESWDRWLRRFDTRPIMYDA